MIKRFVETERGRVNLAHVVWAEPGLVGDVRLWGKDHSWTKDGRDSFGDIDERKLLDTIVHVIPAIPGWDAIMALPIGGMDGVGGGIENVESAEDLEIVVAPVISWGITWGGAMVPITPIYLDDIDAIAESMSMTAVRKHGCEAVYSAGDKFQSIAEWVNELADRIVELFDEPDRTDSVNRDPALTERAEPGVETALRGPWGKPHLADNRPGPN